MRTVVMLVCGVIVGRVVAAAGLLDGVNDVLVLVFFTVFGLVGSYAIDRILPETPAPLPPEEVKRRLKAAVRDVIDSIDPPLSRGDFLDACRQLYRAVMDCRERVTIRVGDRTFQAAIKVVGGSTEITLYLEDQPCP